MAKGYSGLNWATGTEAGSRCAERLWNRVEKDPLKITRPSCSSQGGLLAKALAYQQFSFLVKFKVIYPPDKRFAAQIRLSHKERKGHKVKALHLFFVSFYSFAGIVNSII